MTDRDEFQDHELEYEKKHETLFHGLKIFIATSISILLLLLLLKVQFQMKWIFIGIVFLVSSIIVWILSILWLCKQYIFFIAKQNYPRLAELVLSLSINSTLGLFQLFTLLLCLCLDGMINPHPVLIVLPLIAWIVVILAFIIFIIPGFNDDESGSKKWIPVLILYYISVLYSEVGSLLQMQYSFDWFWVTSILMLAMVYNILILITDCQMIALWPCAVLSAAIYSLYQFTNILNLIDKSEQPSERLQYQTIIPLFAVSLINLFKQVV